MADQSPDVSGISVPLQQRVATNLDQEAKQMNLPLSGVRIGLSVAESDDYKQLGFSSVHQKDLMIELTRYLLVNGAHLVYGGDLRREGYTLAFSELAFQYRSREDQDAMLYTNFFSWPLHLNLTNSDLAVLKRHRVAAVKCDADSNVPEDQRSLYCDASTEEQKLYWGLSLSKMRHEIVKNSDARIVIGGNLEKYSGFYPGIIEEACYTLEAGQPLYLIGAFGGAAAMVIRALEGEPITDLVREINERFAEKGHKSAAAIRAVAEIRHSLRDMEAMLSSIQKLGVAGVAGMNGLSELENHRLFNTIHFHEMIFFILKGLKTKAHSNQN